MSDEGVKVNMTPNSFNALQSEVFEWSTRNFGDVSVQPPYMPLLGAVEELGELAHAELKSRQGIRRNEDHEAAKVDAVADIIIYLADYCSRSNINLADAVMTTWNKVKRRDWKAKPDTAATGSEA